MPIPELQLKTWSNQGATVTSQSTHESIRIALTNNNSPLIKRGFVENKDFEIYLQGSYKNATNIRGDSDVDVVIQFNGTFKSDISFLCDWGKIAYQNSYQNATYLWSDFYADVLEALNLYYGTNNVDATGNKSLKLKKSSNKLAADIVPCIQYRRYLMFSDIFNQSFAEGITFYTRQENRQIINYPKLHFKNGAAKNSDTCTKGYYKSVVRMFKNARRYLVDTNVISKTIAPSYFLECLLYNVPDVYFGYNYQRSYLNIINWLNTSSEKFNSFVSQNEQLPLFGITPEQWSVKNARYLVLALIDLWNTW